MRHIIIAILLGLLSTTAFAAITPVEEKPPMKVVTFEDEIMAAMYTYCLPALYGKRDPAGVAIGEKLGEFPADKALLFAAKGDRVFMINSEQGNMVMVVPKAGGCSILARKIDPAAFWRSAEGFLGKGSPFTFEKETKLEDGLQKQYKADADGAIILFATAKDDFKETGVQATLTAGRVGPEAEATAKAAK